MNTKILNKIWAYQTQQYIKRTIHPSGGIYPRDVNDSISKNQSMWYHIYKLKNKNHKVTSINTEKLLTKVSIHWEKAMAPHSSTVAWKIPWMEEPGRLQSMGSLRVGHDWATSLSLSTFMHWRRKWQPTPVFLPGESHGRRSLIGCSLWGRTELDTTEAT